MFEKKISKLSAQNSTDIHYHHSQHPCRLTEPARVLGSAEDCQIPHFKKKCGFSPYAAILPPRKFPTMAPLPELLNIF